MPYWQILQRFRAEGVNLQALALGRSTFSQFGEDRFLVAHFAAKSQGFYVDVGAFDPFRWSNTCLLYQRGWRGLNIEPDPDAIGRFERYRTRDVNLQIAVSSTSGEASFARSGEYAGLDGEGYLWSERDAERITVPTQPLAQVLEARLPPGQQIDLLDVDCEGLDLVVLQSNDWRRFRPTLVLAEAHGPEETALLTGFMESVGYQQLTRFHLTFVFEAAASAESTSETA
jgi:FkbM family methyltransferase